MGSILSWKAGGMHAASLFAVVAVMVVSLAGCGPGGGGGDDVIIAGDATFLVTDGSGAVVPGATVYLVPAGDVDGSPFDADDVLTGNADDRDEPLEDPVRLNGASYPHATTGPNGQAFIQAIPEGDYFWFVQPGPGDSEHLPGGSGCRFSRNTSSFVLLTSQITLSSMPGSAATYRGSSTCLVCHSSLAATASHAHRLGFAKPGQFGSMQDPSRYPAFTNGWNQFLSAATFNGGTMITCTDFDPTRDFDKFKTFLTGPTGTVYLRVWLWHDTGDGKFKITIENVINALDPASPRTLEVGLTYGGALQRQQFLVKVPGRKGLYPLLQFQTEGQESRFDRTRKVFRDYHLDHFWNAAAQTLVDPPINSNFDANCTACHATGFTRFQDAMTGEWLTDAVDDVAGEYDLDQDGTPDEINIGCESCHGPGSEHVTWAADPVNVGHQRRFVVNPSRLSPSRAVMLCGRCHDRVTGDWSVMANEEPLDAAGQMAPVGISRQDWLAAHASVKGPVAADMWEQGRFSKNYHQQAADLIKSTMHRNDRILTVCGDCHGAHGQAPFDHHLFSDPANPDSHLCQSCHAIDILNHMLVKTGATHAGPSTACVRCHMPKTARGGAGSYGLLFGAPTGTPADDDLVFFENDLASHTFEVPRKSHPSVTGETPAFAMPIPYTNSCGGPCHIPGTIPLTR